MKVFEFNAGGPEFRWNMDLDHILAISGLTVDTFDSRTREGWNPHFWVRASFRITLAFRDKDSYFAIDKITRDVVEYEKWVLIGKAFEAEYERLLAAWRGAENGSSTI